MTDRPIIFSAPMVRALLSGQKTQTRRVVKAGILLDHLKEGWKPEDIANGVASMCPYGQIGDRLWVRETWAHYQTINHVRRHGGRAFDEVSDGYAGYRADGHNTIEDFRTHIRLMHGLDLEGVAINGDKWRPSIHMPRWASRLKLQITDIRVERLQDISEADAQAEGVRRRVGSEGPNLFTIDIDNFSANAPTASEVYRMLWEAINGDGTWSANPWVWAITFEVVK